MKRKVTGILVCMLLIIPVLSVTSTVTKSTEEPVPVCNDEISEESNYAVRLWLGGYIPSEAYLDFIAEHYKFVIASIPELMAALLDRNPDMKIILYTDPVFTQPSISYPEEYYAHSSQSTNYNNRVINKNFGTYLMNMSSEAWRNEVATSARDEVDEHGYYGVMADDCGPDISGRVDLLPDGYNVTKWRADIKDTLSTINDELGNQTLLVFNGIYNDPEYTGRELLEVTDGGIREGFIFHLASGEFLPEEYWSVLLNYIIEDIQTDYHVASAKLKKKNGRTATADERMFAFTSYLLVKNDNVIYSPEDWGLVTGVDETLVQYYPEMDIDLGDPIQTAAKVEDYFNPETSLYERAFSNGKTFVNPSMKSITCHLEQDYLLVIPKGGGVITDDGTYGGSLSYQLVDSITVPAQSGVIILEKDTVNLTISIGKPRDDRFYMSNRVIMPLKNTIIIGRITVQAEVCSINDMDRVEFYIDDELKYEDEEIPYEWLWNEFAVGNHEIKIIAYDNKGNKTAEKIDVMIFNFG